MTRTHQTIWNNQKELAVSEERLDEQFAVLTRMTISYLNSILDRAGGNGRITEGTVGDLFSDWAKFRARPDHKDHMMSWFLGVALDKLPPLQESKPMEEGGSNAEGDHGDTNAIEALSQDGGIGQAYDVPQVQNENRPQG
jgi:hypothetical protein